MEKAKFDKMCAPYNKKFEKLFGYIPDIKDYVCPQEVFFAALRQSVSDKRDIVSQYEKSKKAKYKEFSK